MGWKRLLQFLVSVAFLCGLCTGDSLGKEFITVFMENNLPGSSQTSFQVFITGYSMSTNVNVFLSKTNYEKSFAVNDRLTLAIDIPSSAELLGSKRSTNVVVIQSDKDVTALSLNNKKNRAETSVLYPVEDLGTEYYVVTPTTVGRRQFAVVSGSEKTSLDIYFTNPVQTEDGAFNAGVKSSWVLQPYTAYQFLSDDDLSGTRVLSQKPVAVLSGFTCGTKPVGCNHAFEQLQPVSSWGTIFFIPPIFSQAITDNVYVVASKSTNITYQIGSSANSQAIAKGEVIELNVPVQTPLFITATAGIQVMYLCTGGTHGSSARYNPFLTTIYPTTGYCTSYYIFGQGQFDNFGALVAKTATASKVTFNNKPVTVPWKVIPGTDYSWSYQSLGKGLSFQMVVNPSSPFLLLSYGIASQNSYGSPAICISGPSCSTVTCRVKEKCKILNRKAVCVPEAQSNCHAVGDPHYRTFDGRSYDFQGTCTYTIAKTCGSDTSLTAFNVEAKNENRGNTRVSHVSLVTVKVYDFSISVVRNENGFVRINNQSYRLPIVLNNGQVRLYQSGSSLVMATDFTLTVRYDWNSALVIYISSSYFGNVCGLCGNYNGIPGDDLATPTGAQATNLPDFGKSWKVEDGDRFCWHNCNGECKSCPTESQQKYRGPQACGLISKTGDGPFVPCYSSIDPKIYLEYCVYDMCVYDGSKQIMCQSLKNYAEACQRNNIQINEWRQLAGCPQPCPANSQYKLCGSACPKTCNDEAIPANCSESCVETCECKEGFVLDEGKCIPKNSCGCLYEGRSYKGNEKFWGDTKCESQCVCNPSTRKVECKATRCKSSEKCAVVNGIQDCYPLSYGTCIASGDPHYVTFDGVRYNFQGTCIYQFVGVCKKSTDLVDFLISVQNEYRGNKVVSYTSAVQVTFSNLSVGFKRQYNGRILFNGTMTNLPFIYDKGKLSIYMQGYKTILQTSFGLRVLYDWDSYLAVTIPSTYAGAVCGLCGNFNGDKANEFVMKNNQVTSNTNLFAKSWNIQNTPGCSENDVPDVCPKLAEYEARYRSNKKECGLLIDKAGPFRECHVKIDPEGVFKDCVFDACIYSGRLDVQCKVISSYATSCQEAGATVYPWRSAAFCSPDCGKNSHYEICASGCLPTCHTLAAPLGCNPVCSEGCVCDDGFVLSGRECVSLSLCGCNYLDKYYTFGEVFFPNGTCSQQCVCTSSGAVDCKPFTCGANEACSVVDGVQKCQPVGSAQCSAAGEAHYVSFDGLDFDFQGTCTYILSKTVTLNAKLVPFAINVKNEKSGNGPVSVAKLLSIDVYGYTLTLQLNQRGQILVNGLFKNLPITLEDSKIKAYQNGLRVNIDTDFGLKVSHDLAYSVIVTVPGNYKGQLGGLCGDYNGDRKDEFQLPDKKLAPDATTFGAAWKVQIPGVSCDDGCGGPGNPCPICDDKKKDVFKTKNYCGFLKKSDGPLSACFGTVNPDTYFNSCIFDLCANPGDGNILCHSIQSYVAACQEAGATVQAWRSKAFCPLNCPPNSQYKLCADICSTTCTSITDPAECPTTCSEGCECADGFFFDGQGCVPVDKCGCFNNGKYYQASEVILSSDCKEVCKCNSSGLFVCQANDCAADERCQIKDGIAKCINADPCKSVKCRTKETCKVEDGDPVCVPNYKRVCWALGDPHYQTFDGFNYDFRGTCTYILSKYIGADASLVPFTVEINNDDRGIQTGAFVRTVNAYVYRYKISILKGEFGKVRINDVIANLPVTLLNGKISISISGPYAALRADFGLYVTFDYNGHVTVSLPSSYHDSVCGLCGNFNEIVEDELTGVDKKPAQSIIDWAKNWRVNDSESFCSDDCRGNCSTCDESKKGTYGSNQFCGLISQAAAGPFRECHAKVNPSIFFDNCVNDVCIYNGAKQFLCQSLAAYDAICRKQDAKIYDWRTLSGCVRSCPENSHYDFCGTACPATCVDRDAPAQCNETCVESCQCNDGFVLSSDKCVPVSSCGCSYNGAYYQPNQQFWSDDNCQVLCKCDSITGVVGCILSNCKQNEKCEIVNGQRKCLATSFSNCTASGNLHYKTFDGKTYTFVGTCIYQLIGVTSGDPSLTPFTVDVKNNNRGNNGVPSTKEVTVKVYGLNVTLSMDYPRRILINGVVGELPYYFQTNKIVAYLSGGQGSIKTDFDVTVTYDWNSHVSVTIPGSYDNGVAGLCGNSNKNLEDDLTMKDGKVATSPVQFGDSWKVGDVPGCTPECIRNCPQYTEAPKKPYADDNYCGIIIKSTGPFIKCFAVIDPKPYFNDCVIDATINQGHPSSFCTSIGLYVLDCQSVGVTVQEWRTAAFCSPSCPINSHYELCGNGCPAVCYGLASPADCLPRCEEGCYCNSGFILSGPICVPFAQCGCVYKDRYYQKNDVFYPDDQCKEKCRCEDNGIVQCQDTSCGPDEECKVVNGIQGCQPKEFGTCVVSGYPHYTTFDGLAYDFQGTCAYILSNLLASDSQRVPFSVNVKNENYNSVAVTRMVEVSVFGFTVAIERGMKWNVKVNGEINKLPLVLHYGHIIINQEGNNVILQTSFGLKVLYDTVYYVTVSVPNTYRGKLRGLCGNFNKDQKDEFQLPNSQLTKIVDEFGAAWKVNTTDEKCSNGCGTQCPVCDDAKIKPYTGTMSCGMITNTTGPFKECHAKIAPQKYYNDCTHDACIFQGKDDILCKSLQAYTAACQQIDVTVTQWRTTTFCRLTCPPNSHYEPCTKSCEKTCARLTSPPTCTDQCFEGCECDAGYLFDGDQCVTVDKCGCVFNGRYLSEGQSFMTEDCGLICKCQFASVTCTATACRPTEHCGIKNGVRMCIQEQAQCFIKSQKLVTFDGLSGEPIAPGGYELLSLCNGDLHSWFRVLVDIQSCGTDVPFVARIHIFLHNTQVVIFKDKEAWVKGRLVSFPFKTCDLSAEVVESSVLAKLENMFTIELNDKGELKIRVTDNLAAMVCGACGNFNGHSSDDLMDIQGNNVTDVLTMIKSWKAPDLYTCGLQNNP